MFTKHINNLRNKSESYRHTFAITVSALVTLLILIVWISVMRNNLFINQNETGQTAVATAIAKDVSPLQSLKNSTQRMTDALAEHITEITDALGTVKYTRETE